MSVADAVLEIIPDSVLNFVLSTKQATPTCILELRHPDAKAAPIAYKVKTTQPRRYLVRPNQGLIAPGESQKVQIILVEKDKNSLMQSFQRLGQSALDHSKDKFLVQSVAVLDAAMAAELKDYDKLTALWSSVSGGTAPAKDNNTTSAVANKKLHVGHTVVETDTTSAGGAAAAATAQGIKSPQASAAAVEEAKRSVAVSSREPVDSLSKDQLQSELGSLRRKYDELVAFSVNLTAERDMISNTLEQTKRDLNRQVAKTAAADNARGGSRGAAGGGSSSSTSTGPSFLTMVILAIVMMLLGAKLDRKGLLPSSIPFLGEPAAKSLKRDAQNEL